MNPKLLLGVTLIVGVQLALFGLGAWWLATYLPTLSFERKIYTLVAVGAGLSLFAWLVVAVCAPTQRRQLERSMLRSVGLGVGLAVVAGAVTLALAPQDRVTWLRFVAVLIMVYGVVRVSMVFVRGGREIRRGWAQGRERRRIAKEQKRP